MSRENYKPGHVPSGVIFEELIEALEREASEYSREERGSVYHWLAKRLRSVTRDLGAYALFVGNIKQQAAEEAGDL